MNTTTHISTAERIGRTFGRGWRAYVRGERRASNWLVSKGLPVAGAALLLWVVKLAGLGVLFYAAFWLALLLVLLVLLMFAAQGHDTVDWETPEPELRHGHAGFGLYTHDEYRIDPHDPSDEN